MLAHYGALFFILRTPSEFADRGHISRLPEFFTGAIVFYAIGQIALWIVFFRMLREGKIQKQETMP
jgi:hypothetical protein